MSPLLDLTCGEEASQSLLGRPPRWVHASVVLLAALVTSALLWAFFGRADVVIGGRGMLRPAGDLVRVQPTVGGRLIAVAAREGERVEKGRVLFRLDPEPLERELAQARLRDESARALLDSTEREAASLERQLVLEEELDRRSSRVAEEELLLAESERDRARAHRVEKETLEGQARRELERAERLHQEGVLSAEEAEGRRVAWTVARSVKDAAQADLDSAERRIALQRERLAEREREHDVAREERARRREELASQRVALREQASRTAHDVAQLENALDELLVRAPADGLLTRLHARPGEVAAEGAVLATLAPEGAGRLVEAWVAGRDAGELAASVGKEARVKFDAFPHRDWGSARGTLRWVAPDSVPHELYGRAFRIEVELEPEGLERRGEAARLELGMEATVEIVRSRERLLALAFDGLREGTSAD